MEKTFENFIKAITEKGMKFEAITPKFDRFGYELNKKETFLSVWVSDHVVCNWTFFADLDKNFNWIYDESCEGMSFERYNQANGHSMFSYKQEQKALKEIFN